MNKKDVTMERFRALVDAHGANPERWPEKERRQALDLVSASAEARAVLAEAGRLDNLLDAVPAPSPSPALRRAVLGLPDRLGAPPESGRWGAFWSRLMLELGGWRPVTAAVAAAFVVGIFFGQYFLASPEEAAPGLLQLTIFDSAFTGY